MSMEPRPKGAWMRDGVRYGLLSVLSRVARPVPGPSLRLLYMHRVAGDQVADFDRTIKALTRLGTFLAADAVLAVIRGEKPLDRRFFHLSFDDGFRDILVNALPVLEAHDVPATLFVPTAIIPGDFDDAAAFRAHVRRFPRAAETATWRDLARARGNLIEIASHTRTHARLSAISASSAALQDEILGSKDDLERELGVSCRYIAWPYGRESDIDARALAAVKAAGYSGCFGAFRGRIRPGVTDPFRIARHHIDAAWPLSHQIYFATGGLEGARA